MQLELLVNVVLEEIPDFHHSVVELQELARTTTPSGLT